MSFPKVRLGKDGIMRVEYERLARIHLKDVENEFEQRVALTKEKHPVLVRLQGLAEFAPAAQRFLASKKHARITTAAAILLPPWIEYPILTRYFIESFQSSEKPPFPVRNFNVEGEAVEWLEPFV